MLPNFHLLKAKVDFLDKSCCIENSSVFVFRNFLRFWNVWKCKNFFKSSWEINQLPWRTWLHKNQKSFSLEYKEIFEIFIHKFVFWSQIQIKGLQKENVTNFSLKKFYHKNHTCPYIIKNAIQLHEMDHIFILWS